MALPASGQISLSQVNVELGLSATAQISLGSSVVRNLFGKSSGAISLHDGHGKSNHVPFSTKVTFTANTSWTVPSGIGVNAIRVKAWGASGGGRGTKASAYCLAGAGGFGQADIEVSGGQTYFVAVGGGGGISNNNSGYAAGGINGGGRGSSNIGGGGGGYTGIFANNSASQAPANVIAGGGGGAGSTNSLTYYGGAGGGLSGAAGIANGNVSGGGGTQTAGGASSGTYPGITAGSALQGGETLNPNSMCGAGAGYFGGGGGSKGGGGSGYVTGSNTTTMTPAARAVYPANYTDPDWASPYGMPASTFSVGNNGYVVLYY